MKFTCCFNWASPGAPAFGLPALRPLAVSPAVTVFPVVNGLSHSHPVFPESQLIFPSSLVNPSFVIQPWLLKHPLRQLEPMGIVLSRPIPVEHPWAASAAYATRGCWAMSLHPGLTKKHQCHPHEQVTNMVNYNETNNNNRMMIIIITVCEVCEFVRCVLRGGGLPDLAKGRVGTCDTHRTRPSGFVMMLLSLAKSRQSYFRKPLAAT